jgi:AcrR family transcriptional regulator
VQIRAVLDPEEPRYHKGYDQQKDDDPQHLYPAWGAPVSNGARVRTALIGFFLRRQVGHGFSSIAGSDEKHGDGDTVSTSSHRVAHMSNAYTAGVPKLWNDTIDAHRRAVRDATLDTTAALVAEHGLRSVTMAQIAEGTGIGRATLYKYFPDVEAILLAWHERQISQHLEHLTRVAQEAKPGERLGAVLEAYAAMSYDSRGDHDAELATVLHRDEQVMRAEKQLLDLISGLLTEAAQSGEVRTDMSAAELAMYCVHALGASRTLSSTTAVRRLVTVTLAGLAPAGARAPALRSAS